MMTTFGRSALRIGLSIIALVCVALALFLCQPVRLLYWSEIRAGNEIVSRVEAFRVAHKQLPDTLKEVGVEDENLHVFYRKMSDDEYCVWFGTSLGESETYNSRRRRWE